jgi:hypothetical protein
MIAPVAINAAIIPNATKQPLADDFFRTRLRRLFVTPDNRFPLSPTDTLSPIIAALN